LILDVLEITNNVNMVCGVARMFLVQFREKSCEM
jgi:hypothetical protein